MTCIWLATLLAPISLDVGAQPQPETTDPLAERGYSVTRGAAPGYVEDRVCGSCHADLYHSYQEVAMARSFYRPRADNDIEDFSAGYYHEPSRRHYQMVRRGDQLIMRRYQIAADGEPIHEVEQSIDWILGSGNHSRTYLFGTPGGELYQLPLAWYTQTQTWGMAPGFDNPQHLGLSRRVRRECMFCHNAYPDVPEGSDTYASPHLYPQDLPEGLGCQRCHGPGAEHSRLAMSDEINFKQLYASILNPADLEPERRADICYQCHMQPSIAIPGRRKFGRMDYSYRPGEALADYMVGIDIVDADKEQSERFEINHHPYRLEQSQCFIASEGKLSCLTCHDPHRKVPAAEQAAHYRAACLSCHEVDTCRLEEMAEQVSTPDVAADNCIACHMQERRTQDVVKVTMTDHLIRRRPGGSELLAPLQEHNPNIADVVFMDPAEAEKEPLRDVYRAFTVAEFTGGGHTVAVDKLQELLPELQLKEPEPYYSLARGHINHQRYEAAIKTLDQLLELSPNYPTARELRGLSLGALGRRQEGIAEILKAIEIGQERPEARSNLGVLLIQSDRPAEALPHLERAIELRPSMSDAWFYLGVAQTQLNRFAEAAQSYRQTLAIEPMHSRAYLALAQVLVQQDRRDEAIRYLRHGAEHAKRPDAIASTLKRLEEKTSGR